MSQTDFDKPEVVPNDWTVDGVTDLSCATRICLRGYTNQAVQPQKMARGLKFGFDLGGFTIFVVTAIVLVTAAQLCFSHFFS